jgi:mono/diheme cytochrome c family protein
MDIRPLRYLALSILLAFAGCTVLDPNPGASINRHSDDTTSGEMTGQQLYLRDCANCHGLEGTSVDTLTVKSIKGYDRSYEEFDSVMTSGPGAMPRYPQIDSLHRRMLYQYIKTL